MTTTTNTFRAWLQTFIDEKGLDLDAIFDLTNGDMMNYGFVTESLLTLELTVTEMSGIRDMIVRIDFANGDVYDFLRFLGERLGGAA